MTNCRVVDKYILPPPRNTPTTYAEVGGSVKLSIILDAALSNCYETLPTITSVH